MSNEEKQIKKLMTIMFVVCLVMFAGGIALLMTIEDMSKSPEPGETWRVVLGSLSMAFGGFGLIGCFIYAVRRRTFPGIWNPLEAMIKKEISEERYNRIRRTEIAALVILLFPVGAILFSWHPVPAFLFGGPILVGAIGAPVLCSRGKPSLQTVSAVGGFICGVMASLFQTPSRPEERQYEYFINGVKVGEGTERSGGGFMGFVGGVLICYVLSLLMAYLITYLCTVMTKEKNPADAPPKQEDKK